MCNHIEARFSNAMESEIKHGFNNLLVLRNTSWSNLSKFCKIIQGLFLLIAL